VTTRKTRKAEIASQHPDSKGINAKRDANRATGAGAVTMTKGQGTAKFRKTRSGID
jgi:hypothetical protein